MWWPAESTYVVWTGLESESAMLCIPGPDTNMSILMDGVVSMPLPCGCLSSQLGSRTTSSLKWQGAAVQDARFELLSPGRQSPLGSVYSSLTLSHWLFNINQYVMFIKYLKTLCKPRLKMTLAKFFFKFSEHLFSFLLMAKSHGPLVDVWSQFLSGLIHWGL